MASEPRSSPNCGKPATVIRQDAVLGQADGTWVGAGERCGTISARGGGDHVTTRSDSI
jgi:hypothetical protein